MTEVIDKGLIVNPEKDEIVQSGDKEYYCRALKTKLVTAEDTLSDIIAEYAKPYVNEGDILFISEKMIACLQKRAIPISSIKPGFFARFLSRFVTKPPIGVALNMPEMMQCAIDEGGLPRILLATIAGAIGKLFRRKGWFYRVAGQRVASIDGPNEYTIPPYNNYIVLAPLDADKTAESIADMLDGVIVLIVDVNDLGANILGRSEEVDTDLITDLLKQNPLGQGDQSTPMGVLTPSLFSE